jgi:hypothetical protein
MTVSILAYGSLIDDPGFEISPLIAKRIPTETPFPVEYARESETRGGSYTVVPHSTGKAVKAEVLVLSEGVSLKVAKDLLYRRERRKEGSGVEYEYNSSRNAVVVQDKPGFQGIDHVLYTDFNPEGKITNPNPQKMAEAAIKSVRNAPCGKDGISYLINLISNGVITELTDLYKQEVLKLTRTTTLSEALQIAKTEII